VTKELDQEPKHAYDLSEDDRKKALSSLIFLKEKKNGTIKADLVRTGVFRGSMLQKRKHRRQRLDLIQYL
jgi:hypothetical protein